MRPDSPPPAPLPAAEYWRVLKPLLPKAAFRSAPGRVGVLMLHLLVVAIGMTISIRSEHWGVQLLLLPVIGHGMAGVTFLSHDLSHGSIIRSAGRRYPLEVLSWALVYTSTTMWWKVHVKTHHLHTQTTRDSDRVPFQSEKNLGTELFKPTYPHREMPWWNPLVGLQVALYVVGNNLVSLRYGLDPRRPDSPYVYAYQPKEWAKLVFEMLVLVALHAGIYWAAGGLLGFLLVDLFPFFIGSSIMMAYIATNHGLNPLTESVDPVVGSTTVEVPTFIARLHSNFAYHTEHHLFPAMDPRWYPEVGRLLSLHFSDRYQKAPLLEVWRRLYQRSPYLEDSAGTVGYAREVAGTEVP
jgi:fatty acid desaturase